MPEFLDASKPEDTGKDELDNFTNEKVSMRSKRKTSGARLLEGFKPEDMTKIDFDDDTNEMEMTRLKKVERPTLTEPTVRQTIPQKVFQVPQMALLSMDGATPQTVPKQTLLTIEKLLLPQRHKNEDIAEALARVLVDTRQAMPEFLDAFKPQDTGNYDGVIGTSNDASKGDSGATNGTSDNGWHDAPDNSKADVADNWKAPAPAEKRKRTPDVQSDSTSFEALSHNPTVLSNEVFEYLDPMILFRHHARLIPAYYRYCINQIPGYSILRLNLFMRAFQAHPDIQVVEYSFMNVSDPVGMVEMLQTPFEILISSLLAALSLDKLALMEKHMILVTDTTTLMAHTPNNLERIEQPGPDGLRSISEDIAEALVKFLVDTRQAMPEFLDAFKPEDTGNFDIENIGLADSFRKSKYIRSLTLNHHHPDLIPASSPPCREDIAEAVNGISNDTSKGDSGATNGTSDNGWRDAPDGSKADVADNWNLLPQRNKNEDIAEALVKFMVDTRQAVSDFSRASSPRTRATLISTITPNDDFFDEGGETQSDGANGALKITSIVSSVKRVSAT
ncbi:hypothetical protein MMC07_000964 [Pseudocyphellaria aurata]|nr:hypothetical protein [Pseudocyphellaria aurata]